MMARLIPRGRENEFFGFYAFTGKATAFVGPMLLGILTEIFKSQRYGVSVVMLMFFIGAIILNFVDEKEGIKYASKSVE
jgi:UMF1 family MFS transporter